MALLRAIAFAEYLETHAKRAYGSGPEAPTAAAKAILKRIRAGDLKGGFTARDVHQQRWAGLAEHDAVHAGLDLLDGFGWISGARRETGGRPTIVYSINPAAMR